VTPGYAEALGIRIKSGRLFTDADVDSSTDAVIVNEEFVRTYWNDGKPVVGRRHEGVFGAKGTTSEVVGVVANMLKDGNDRKPEPEVFMPAKRTGRVLGRGMSLAIRTDRDPVSLVPDLRRLVLDVEPQAALDSVGLLTSRVSASVAQPRFSASVLGGFAVLALLLAAIGLYGVLSYGVSQRRREMGIRAAMGASRGQLVRLVVQEGMVVVVVGLVVGLGAAAGLARFIETLLFGITPLDLWAYALAPAVLLMVAVIACAIPARRAARVDPAEALRCE
jgi:predicted permease